MEEVKTFVRRKKN